jgi:hypothetical protein
MLLHVGLGGLPCCLLPRQSLTSTVSILLGIVVNEQQLSLLAHRRGRPARINQGFFTILSRPVYTYQGGDHMPVPVRVPDM